MKLYVFDFHGTLEDGHVGAFYETLKYASSQVGLEFKLGKDFLESNRGHYFDYYFRHAFPNARNNEFLISKLVRIAEAVGLEFAYSCIKPKEYAKFLLTELKNFGDVVVVSNSKQEVLEEFLKITKLNDVVNEAYGVKGNTNEDFVVKKSRKISKLYKRNNYKELVLVGDSEEDRRLANILKSNFKNVRAYIIGENHKTFNIESFFMPADNLFLIFELESLFVDSE